MRVNQTRELLEMRMRQEYEQAVTVLIDEKTSNQKKKSTKRGRSKHKRAKK